MSHSRPINLKHVSPPAPPRRQPRPVHRRPPLAARRSPAPQSESFSLPPLPRPAALPPWPTPEGFDTTRVELEPDTVTRPPVAPRPAPPVLRSVPPPAPMAPPLPPVMASSPPPAPVIDTPLPSLPSLGLPLLPPDAGTNEFTFQGASIPSLMKRLTTLSGGNRQRVLKVITQLRLLYQLKVVAQLEHLKQLRRMDKAQLNRLIVAAYKVVGFSVLTLIVLGLLLYMGANVFYYLNSTWIEPTVVSPTDERVLQLSSKLAEQMSARDKLAAELADAERIVAMHEDYQDSLKRVLQADLADRQKELSRLSALNKHYAVSRGEILRANRAYSGMSRKRIGEQFGARLIDRDTMINGNYQLSQIANGNLALAEKAIDIEKRTSSVSRDADGLATILGSNPGGQLSIEVLRIKHDYQRSQVELAKARDDQKALKASLERYDRMVKTISDSPFIKAVDNKATIALVPYDNLGAVKPGAPLYGCYVGLFFCKKVGTVVELLSGEVSLKHPLHNQMVRGQTVHLALTDPKWAQRKVLFSGGRPILF
jgi:hypothetical protein